MKKIIFALAAALLAVACTNKEEEFAPDTTLYRSGTVNLCASIEDLTTRMVIDLAGHGLWSEGDKIAVACSDGSFVEFVLNGTGDTKRAIFTGNIPEGKTLGRLASEAASILRGKKKPIYTPHVDTGDYVIIINAEKVEVTGKKRKEKIYKRHTGYPGGLREVTFEQMMVKHPTEVVRHAVKGMMPNGKLGRQMYKKLKVYAGPEHDHAAQKPEVLDI